MILHHSTQNRHLFSVLCFHHSTGADMGRTLSHCNTPNRDDSFVDAFDSTAVDSWSSVAVESSKPLRRQFLTCVVLLQQYNKKIAMGLVTCDQYPADQRAQRGFSGILSNGRCESLFGARNFGVDF